ncbi:hypothetical protein L1049_012109 [Liquidambar formosana]|uniref:protein-serine/threonine phosphatase n=1 Tax=Liquidambar formosana TaxID=63359 RepID=A0AAP0X3R8_LIQFO
MAGICCGVVGESETSAPVEPSSRVTRRRRMEIRQFKFVADVAMPPPEDCRKRQKIEVYPQSFPRECENAVESCAVEAKKQGMEGEGESERDKGFDSKETLNLCEAPVSVEGESELVALHECPKFGMTSVCGRRRDMEDAVAIHPSFCRRDRRPPTEFHFFGVYDGHGCSHVAMKCKARLHEIVKEELESGDESWKEMMERSFLRMDEEVHEWSNGALSSKCRCELQTPQCDAVGSTAVVAIVTPDKIIVSNCGDSRAVLCRNGVAIPLSSDHKPDRPDELRRIQDAGGRVIYWDGPRVLGVLAMSRAIGDNYLKPYVISEPEVTDNGSDGGGRVSDPGERRAVGRGDERHRLRSGAQVPPRAEATVAAGVAGE